MNLNSNTVAQGVVVIDCPIENLDASNVKTFRESIKPLISGQSRVVLNMSQMKFVDSSGLGALISCLREVNEQKGQLKLCAMTRSVRALFELMRMNRVFDIFETQDEAISSF